MIKQKKLKLIEEVVCEYFDCSPDVLRVKSRKHEHKFKRFWFYWLAYTRYGESREKGLTYMDIGAYLGVHHSTVLNGINKTKAYIDTEKPFKATSDALIALFRKKDTYLHYTLEITSKEFTKKAEQWYTDFRGEIEELEKLVNADVLMEGYIRRLFKRRLYKILDVAEVVKDLPSLYNNVEADIVERDK